MGRASTVRQLRYFVRAVKLLQQNNCFWTKAICRFGNGYSAARVPDPKRFSM
jgi:hypothetical protein